MAVSPLPPVSQRGEHGAQPAKSSGKSLPMRSNSAGGPPTPVEVVKPKAAELAEHLNDEIRQKYVKDKKVGEGTYANVYLGHLISDPTFKVAIKKIKVNTEYQNGLAMDAIREVKHLQELSHPNVIALLDVFSSKNQNLNLVLEFLPLGDLEQLIKDQNGIIYGTAEVKAWMNMLARGVWFCHENFVLHRDIKPNNLLIAADGEIKLADFGLARSFADPYRPMSFQVITRWYRPPELLFNARYYSSVVDVWSMGLVFAELILRVPFLAGNTDMHQLELICQALGAPSEENWPGVSKLEGYVKFDKPKTAGVGDKNFFLSMFGTVGPVGVDLLMSMLVLDPRKRATARQILQHQWWTVDPRPTAKADLPKKGGGVEKMGDDLKNRGGELEDGRTDRVARRLDFGGSR